MWVSLVTVTLAVHPLGVVEGGCCGISVHDLGHVRARSMVLAHSLMVVVGRGTIIHHTGSIWGLLIMKYSGIFVRVLFISSLFRPKEVF